MSLFHASFHFFVSVLISAWDADKLADFATSANLDHFLTVHTAPLTAEQQMQPRLCATHIRLLLLMCTSNMLLQFIILQFHLCRCSQKPLSVGVYLDAVYVKKEWWWRRQTSRRMILLTFCSRIITQHEKTDVIFGSFFSWSDPKIVNHYSVRIADY